VIHTRVHRAAATQTATQQNVCM